MREVWVLVPISAFVAIAWVIHVIVDGFRRRQQLRISTEFHSKLLERIGSATEFGEFLNSPGGAKFIDSLTLEKEGGGGAHVRILRALQTGLVFLALGVGLFLYGETHPSLSLDGRYAVDLIATIVLTVGVGLLVSAGISYRLSLRLGSMNGPSEPARERLPTV